MTWLKNNHKSSVLCKRISKVIARNGVFVGEYPNRTVAAIQFDDDGSDILIGPFHQNFACAHPVVEYYIFLACLENIQSWFDTSRNEWNLLLP